MKKVIQVILVIAVLILSYFIYDSIQQPIRFNKEQQSRYDDAIVRLKDIRTAQIAFKDVYGMYTGSFDTLVNFLNTGNFKVVKMIGTIPDSLLDAGMDEKQALKLKFISRDTIEVSVKDSLFKKPNFSTDSLRYVPHGAGKQFELAKGEVTTGSKVVVQVFEAKVHNDVLLHGLEKQLIINFNDYREKYAGYPGS